MDQNKILNKSYNLLISKGYFRKDYFFRKSQIPSVTPQKNK